MNGPIYNQRRIPSAQWRYGFRSSASTGCGWIATYNALFLMGYTAKPEKLIEYYVRHLPLINGNFGTFLPDPALFFKKHGFGVKICLRPSGFDGLARSSDACILYYCWNKKLQFGAHFTALRYDGRGFVGYNTYRNSSGPDSYGDSVSKFLKERKYFFPVLIGITDREKCGGKGPEKGDIVFKNL